MSEDRFPSWPGAAPAGQAEHLRELTAVTEAYARYSDAGGRGLSWLPFALAMVLAGGVAQLDPGWGLLARLLLPLFALLGPQLLPGPYQRLGRVAPRASASSSQAPWARVLGWVAGFLGWVLAWVQVLSFRREALLEAPPLPRGLALGVAVVVLLLLGALAARAPSNPRVGLAGGLAGMAVASQTPLDGPMMMGSGVLLLAGVAFEHWRFRVLERRLASLRGAP